MHPKRARQEVLKVLTESPQTFRKIWPQLRGDGLWTFSADAYYGTDRALQALRKLGLARYLTKSQGGPGWVRVEGEKKRCSNPDAKDYHRYGGRGIRVCKEWMNSSAFCEWALASGWRPGLTLDRIDNDGDYSPRNCRFITHRRNCQNRSETLRRELPVGVRRSGHRYSAKIMVEGTLRNLGTFDTVREASAAYKAEDRIARERGL